MTPHAELAKRLEELSARLHGESTRCDHHYSLDRAAAVAMIDAKAALEAAQEREAKARDVLMHHLIGCPDCDHGIRGGQPCGTCGGSGFPPLPLYIEFVIQGFQKEIATERQRAEAAERERDEWARVAHTRRNWQAIPRWLRRAMTGRKRLI